MSGNPGWWHRIKTVFTADSLPVPDESGSLAGEAMSPEDPPGVGAVLCNRYRLDAKLGEGASGPVFRAWDLSLEIDLAVKLLLAPGTVGPTGDMASMLRNEARLSMGLAHSSICKTYTYDQHMQWHILVMEYVNGPTLEEHRKRFPGGRLPERDLVAIGANCLDALAYAHQEGVIHNDIKPNNVLLTSENGVKVCDFGLAQLVSMVTKTSDLLAGTPAYMSPERIRGKQGEPRSDLYSLAAMLYRLGNGRSPFGSKMKSALTGHLKRPVPPSEHLSPAIHSVLLVAMSKDPDERFQNAEEMRVALMRSLDGKVVVGGGTGSGSDELATQTPAPMVDALPSEPGASVEERSFRFIRPIGRGAFGEVYLVEQATSTGFQRQVAIKLLLPGLGRSDAAHRLRDEARILGRLRHRNIVAALDLVFIRGRWGMVMDYVPGIDLEQALQAFIRSGTRCPDAAALEIGAGIFSALHGAYTALDDNGAQLAVVHRDIKPSNVRLTADGEVKVLDFGVATTTMSEREARTRVGGVIGTELYLAPERILGQDSGHAGDVYAATATLLEMMKGERFGRTPVLADLHEPKLEAALAPVVRQLLGPQAAKDELIALLRAGLATAPEDRPTAEEAAEKLHRLSRQLTGDTLSQFTRRFVPQVEVIMAATPAPALARMEASRTPYRKLDETPKTTPKEAAPATKPAPVPQVEVANPAPAPTSSSNSVAPSPQAVGPALKRATKSISTSARRREMSTLPNSKPRVTERPDRKLDQRPGRLPKKTTPRVRSPTRLEKIQSARGLKSDGGRRRAAKPQVPSRETVKRRTTTNLPTNASPPAKPQPRTPTSASTRAPVRASVPADMAEITARDCLFRGKTWKIGAFLLERNEVSNEDYLAFVQATKTPPPIHWRRGKPSSDSLKHPVVGVGITQARAYAAWRNRRLPTLIEWLAASVGTPPRLLPWGNSCDGSSCHCPLAKHRSSAPVGSYPSGASPEGVLDLIGNVWEWVEPHPGCAPPAKGRCFAMGGSFRQRCKAKEGPPITELGERSTYQYLGFRCAQDK